MERVPIMLPRAFDANENNPELLLSGHSPALASLIECRRIVTGANMDALLQVSRTLIAVLLAAALLSGCGTTTDENASLIGKPLKGAQARLKITRANELMAAGPAARVKIDGREIANLGVGGSTMLDVPVGARRISVDQEGHPNAYAITLQAKAGMLYTLEISPRAESVMSGALFGLVGMLVEAAVNENGGTFQIRIVEAKPARG